MLKCLQEKRIRKHTFRFDVSYWKHYDRNDFLGLSVNIHNKDNAVLILDNPTDFFDDKIGFSTAMVKGKQEVYLYTDHRRNLTTNIVDALNAYFQTESMLASKELKNNLLFSHLEVVKKYRDFDSVYDSDMERRKPELLIDSRLCIRPLAPISKEIIIKLIYLLSAPRDISKFTPRYKIVPRNDKTILQIWEDITNQFIKIEFDNFSLMPERIDFETYTIPDPVKLTKGLKLNFNSFNTSFATSAVNELINTIKQ